MPGRQTKVCMIWPLPPGIVRLWLYVLFHILEIMCHLAWFLSNLTSIMHMHYVKIGIFICCSNITDDHAHHFTSVLICALDPRLAPGLLSCVGVNRWKSPRFIYSSGHLCQWSQSPWPRTEAVGCITGYAKHSIWSLCHNSQTVMLIPEGFWFVQIRGRISDFCIRLLVKQWGFVMHWADWNIHQKGRILLVMLHLCNVNMRPDQWIISCAAVVQLSMSSRESSLSGYEIIILTLTCWAH